MAVANIADIPEDAKARFWAKVEKRGPDECWNWSGARNRDGYGSFGVRRKIETASRLSMILDGRPVPPPPGNHALHSCDNKACVNPRHLSWGTHRRNMAERDARLAPYQVGRKGEQHHSSKLTEEQARFVLASPLSGLELAALLGVHKATISDVRTRKTWKHLT